MPDSKMWSIHAVITADYDHKVIAGRAAGGRSSAIAAISRWTFRDHEWRAAGSENIHAAVIVTLHDSRDFRGAADARQTFGHGKQHTEFRFLREAIIGHGAVTRLKNVQGKLRAGEKDDVQRKKRNAFWPHGSQR